MDYQQNIIVNKLPDEGLVRVKQFVNYTYTDKKTNKIVKVIGALAMSKSKFLQGVKDGIFPQPSKKFGSRCTCWDVSDIRSLIKKTV